MTGQIKFSVVISAYNVEEYLPGLLQDLLEQTYNNFEVILEMTVLQIRRERSRNLIYRHFAASRQTMS